ncbi:helix-turn-helix domain-containing protein [Candidatus Stoquefichus sp. SB1]|uniref:helix-turn-helix domain-containing protein n=1 Tax=Candidatus Stoquefichus sp. SB1 TaxID=1658109 RepID=UPI00067E9C0C|nr:helix-turn-helix transcriptional regulator [Candidatus Stoquefichus sp. SB1]
MDKYDIDLAELRSRIVKLGKTQKDLAKKKGCTLNTINRLLHGKIKMTIEDALFFCNELHIYNEKEKCKIFLPDSTLKWDKENDKQHKKRKE